MKTKYLLIFSLCISIVAFSQNETNTSVHVAVRGINNCDQSKSTILINVLENVLDRDQEIAYRQQHIANNDFEEIIQIKTVDFDKDGDEDILALVDNGNRNAIYLYDNIGSGTFNPLLLLINIGSLTFDYHDYDDDGDLDLIVGDTNEIEIYENRGNYVFTKISDWIGRAKRLELADFNNDGLVDIYASNLNSYIYLNQGNANFSSNKFSASRESISYIADLDKDLNIDIIETNDDQIIWHKNDGFGNFTPTEVVAFQTDPTPAGERERLNFSKVLDFDDDGDMDILAYIYKNLSFQDDYTFAIFTNDGNQNFTRIDQFTSDISRYYLEIVDVDGDGDLDVVGNTPCYILDLSDNRQSIEVFYNNNDGTYSSAHPYGVTGSVLYSSDLNGDGTKDLVRGCKDQFSWFSETHRSDVVTKSYSYSVDDGTTFQESNTFMNLEAGSYNILVRNNFSGDEIRYSENPLLIEEASLQITHIIKKPVFNCANPDGAIEIMASIAEKQCEFFESVIQEGNINTNYFIDLDQDGLMDIVSINQMKRSIVWKENIGEGTFLSSEIYRRTDQDDITSISFTDIDQDGDLDIIGQLNSNNEFLSYNDGNQSFSKNNISSFRFSGEPSDKTIDWDQNGEMDLFFFDRHGTLILYTNNGNERFTRVDLLDHPSEISDIVFRDFNDDGKMDVVCISKSKTQASLYLNQDNNTFIKKEIFDFNTSDDLTVNIADIDNDNDLDVVLFTSKDKKGVVYINTGDEIFTEQIIHIEADYNNIHSVVSLVKDLDNDGIKDIVVGSNYDQNLVWFKNKTGTSFEKRILNTKIPNAGLSSIEIADLDIDGDLDILLGGINGSFRYMNTCVTRNVNDDFLYSIDNGINYQTSSEFENLSSNEYVIKVKKNNCEASQNTVVDYLHDDFSINEILVTNPSRCGVSDGIISIDASLEKKEYGGFDNSMIITRDDIVYSNLRSVDFDKDSDIDIMVSTKDELLFLENIGNNKYRKNFIGTLKSINKDQINPLYILDFNNDGNLDIVTSSLQSRNIVWYNRINNQKFVKYLIEEDLKAGFYILPVDYDSDGDIDILHTSSDKNQIVLYENDGHLNFQTSVLVSDISSIKEIRVSDIDEDGILDLLGYSYENTYFLFKNLGNSGFETQMISSDLYQLYSGENTLDTDIDGDQDLITFLDRRNEKDAIVLKINKGSNMFEEVVLSEVSANHQDIIHLTDVDADGLKDILFSNRISGGRTVEWIKNFGNGTFSNNKVIMTMPVALPDLIVEPRDLNYDGISDLIIGDGGNLSFSINEFNSEPKNEELQFSINGGAIFQNSPVFTALGSQQHYQIRVQLTGESCLQTLSHDEIIFLSTTNFSDADGDGVLDDLEDINQDCNLENDDTDSDGIPDYLDDDDDGDGILTKFEDTNQNGTPVDDDQDGDRIPDYLDFDEVLSTNNSRSEAIVSVYPNPMKNNIFINSSIDNLAIELFDINGKMIIRQRARSKKEMLSIHDLPSGLYVLHMYSNTHHFYKKIMKE